MSGAEAPDRPAGGPGFDWAMPMRSTRFVGGLFLVGSIVLAGITGWLLSYLVVPPRSPGTAA